MENGTSSGDRLGEGNSSAIALDFNETHIVTGAGCGNQSLLWEGSSECTRLLQHRPQTHSHPHLHWIILQHLDQYAYLIL